MKNMIVCQGSDAMERAIQRIATSSKFAWEYLSVNQDLNQFQRSSRVIGLWVEMSTAVNSSLIGKWKNLKLIATTTTGVSHIDLEYIRRREIYLLDLTEFRNELNKITSTAELSWLLILGLWRKVNLNQIYTYPDSFNELRWAHPCTQIQGKTLGIIGFGRIGSKVSEYARAFGMNVITYDPNISEKSKNLDYVSVMSNLSEVLQLSDVCLLAASQGRNQSKAPILGCAEISQLKHDAIIVNISRGSLWDELCVKDALTSGKIGGVGVDVYAAEELYSGGTKSDSPLFNVDASRFNILRTPHIGGATLDAIDFTSGLMSQAIEQKLIQFL